MLGNNTISLEFVQLYIKDYLNNLDFIHRVEPFRLHERLATQQGVFFFPFNIDKTFEQNLCATFELEFEMLLPENAIKVKYQDLTENKSLAESICVIKIILPRAWHKDIILDLNSMNINSTSLFPGLDGFARSLKTLIREYEQPVNSHPMGNANSNDPNRS